MPRRAFTVPYLVTLAVPAAAWWAIQGNPAALDGPARALAVGRLFGLLGAVALVWQVLLVSRWKPLEGRIGLDRLTGSHHANAFFALACLLAHGALVTWGHAQEDFSTAAEKIADFWRTWDGMRGALVAAGMLVALTLLSLRRPRRLLGYERWYRPHLAGYLAVVLAFPHQVRLGGDLVGHPRMLAGWCACCGLAALVALGRRFWMPLLYFRRHRFFVARVEPVPGDVTNVEIGGRDLGAFPARGGQFVRVRFLAPGFLWEAHPFSLSAPPDGKRLRLSIKRLGDFTTRVPDLPVGTPVLVDGPHGIFTAERARGSKVLLIAAGIGVTPIRAILEDLLAAGKAVVMLYCNRNERGIALRDELEAVAAAGGARVVHILSDDPAWTGEKGFLDEARLRALVPDLAEREVFQCGPPPFMDGLRAALVRLGVRPDAIYDERFSF